MNLKQTATILFLALTYAHFSYAISVDQPAPAFSLKNAHQQIRTLRSGRGQVIFIDFWAGWCAPCRQELPEVQRLAKDYGKRLRVFAINVDQDPTAGRALLASLGLTVPRFEVLWDTKNKTVSRYNIQAMPTSLVIDQKGIIRAIYSGFHPTDPNAWRHAIAVLLK